MEDNKRREKKIKIKGISTLSVRQGRRKNGTNVKKITAKEIEGNSKNKRLSSMIFGSTEPSEYLEDGEYISIEEFKEAFRQALENKMPTVIDCIIDSDAKVWPMVAPGAAISEVFDDTDQKK